MPSLNSAAKKKVLSNQTETTDEKNSTPPERLSVQPHVVTGGDCYPWVERLHEDGANTTKTQPSLLNMFVGSGGPSPFHGGHLLLLRGASNAWYNR